MICRGGEDPESSRESTEARMVKRDTSRGRGEGGEKSVDVGGGIASHGIPLICCFRPPAKRHFRLSDLAAGTRRATLHLAVIDIDMPSG